MEQRRKETATEAVGVYQATIGNVTPKRTVRIKRNFKMPVKGRTLHHPEPYNSRSTTLLCFIMLALMKSSTGLRSIWMLISLLLT
jgi:hypothetical protein